MPTPTSVTGSDGKNPIYEPNRRWSVWNIDEIYKGGIANQMYVPNVGDLLVNVAVGEWYRVTQVDETTLISTWVVWKQIPDDAMSDIDVLLGPAPGTVRDTYRAYIDKSVRPYTLVVDQRLRYHSVNATKCKIFRRNTLTNNDDVVSAFYDQSGQLLGQEVPLVLVDMPNGQNFATKGVAPCYTTVDIADGDTLTVVAYDDAGGVCSISAVLALNTAFIASSDTSLKYITGISLESPFLSESDPRLIEYPLNVPLSGLNLIGVVTYSNGDPIRLPVDQTKFSVWGIQDQGFVSTIIGQEFPVVLKYQLSPNEIVYGATVGENKVMTEDFTAKTVDADGAYTVKLFGYPVWIDALNGYRLEWYLYNLDRNLAMLVTPYVRVGDNSPVFNPVGYGLLQRLSVAINLKDVNGLFKSYRHVQSIAIQLMGPGTDRTTNWTIGFAPSQNPPYGRNNFATSTFVNQNLSKVRIDMGATTQADWMNRIYTMTLPLFDETKEPNVPDPTFFALSIPGSPDVEFTIDQWNSELEMDVHLPDSGTLFVKFYRKTSNDIIELSVAAMPIYQNP